MTELEQIEQLTSRFCRKIPTTKEYTDRLAEEVELILKHRFVKHFVRVHQILELAKDFPHITRGSAGCSLVCFLMGIGDVDPIEQQIPLARFINPKRDEKELTETIRMLANDIENSVFTIPLSEPVPDLTIVNDMDDVESFVNNMEDASISLVDILVRNKLSK